MCINLIEAIIIFKRKEATLRSYFYYSQNIGRGFWPRPSWPMIPRIIQHTLAGENCSASAQGSLP